MTASSASVSAPSPVPLAIARSMLSLGIEASLAFCTASASEAFPTRSPPPSFAATVIARVSLVKSLPRRESTIAFLCLIDAHLEWPDMASGYPAVQRFEGRRAARRGELLRARAAGGGIGGLDRAAQGRGQGDGIVAAERFPHPRAVEQLSGGAHRGRPAGHRLDEHEAERLAP